MTRDEGGEGDDALRAVPSSLDAIRARIDGIDDELLRLINERAELARAVGEAKRRSDKAVDFYRPEREAHVLRRVLAGNPGPIRDDEMVRLFREIMSACLAQQEPLRIAFLGPEGTFTQAAVFKHFGHSARALPVGSIEEVFQEVEAGLADFGVVPVENSTEGTVHHTLDMFLSSPLTIGGEIELRIEQHLLARHPASLGSVERVCAHPQSLAQCRGWLTDHLPGAERVGVSSNAEGARRARDERGTAAIAGRTAGEIYGLEVLAEGIEDRPDNTTRFLVVGRKVFAPSGQDKTTVLVSTGGTEGPGVLHRLLAPLATHGVSMTRIESRPSRRGKWDYVFFLDLAGHAEDPPVAAALAELDALAAVFRVLGSYPRAVL